jgi:PAS domain S-box-containing protein
MSQESLRSPDSAALPIESANLPQPAPEVLLSAIVNASDDAILFKSVDGIISTWNPAAAQIFGYTAEEIIGKPGTVLIPPDRLQEHEVILASLRQGIPTNHFETVLLHKGGTPVDVSVTVSPIKDANDQVIGASTITRDITERKQMERDRLLLAAIVNASDDALFSNTLDGIITTWNPAAEWIFGYTAEEIIGKPGTVLVPSDRLQEEEVILASLRQGIPTDHFETVRLHKNATPLDVSVTISPIKDGEGQVIGASTTIHDITARERAEERIQQMQTRLEETQRLGHVGSWEFDVASGRIMWSEAHFRLFERDPASGAPSLDQLLQYFHPDDVPVVNMIAQKAIADGLPYANAHRIRKQDGSLRWIYVIGNAQQDAQGKVVRLFGMAMDVTGEREA